MNCLPRSCLYAVLMALPALVLAQQKDPTDPKASVPPVVYTSPLKQYRPLADEQVVPWKTANEVVEKAGGWKAYAKEAQEPQGAAPAVKSIPQTAPQAKPAAHEGHATPKKN